MTFTESIRVCFSKYADFSGRASRPEYWWFCLFIVLAGAALSLVNNKLSSLFYLATLLPSIAAATRRLHDTDRSGWLQLIALVPVLGWIAAIYLLAQPAKEPNRFGTHAATITTIEPGTD